MADHLRSMISDIDHDGHLVASHPQSSPSPAATPSTPLSFGGDAAVVGAKLSRDGYVQVDDFLGAARARKLRGEIEAAAEQGLLCAQQFEFGVKPQVFELDLHRLGGDAPAPASAAAAAAAAAVLPGFTELFNQSCPELIEALNNLRCQPPLNLRPRVQGPDDSVTLKLQCNRGGGGCFPWHYDNPGPPNQRRITCLVYLNPDWQVGDGGELQLLPFLGGGAVTIAPKMDRAVLFYSDRVLHRVLPAVAERYVFTIWIDADDANADAEGFLRPHHLALPLPDLCHLLRTTPLQRVFSRAVYREEYTESLRQCMGKADHR
eukprot:SAG22_NODE_4842_length_1153_cov_0.675522_1_plen_318_part_01